MQANRLENWRPEVINRKDIHGSDYNPRRISPSAEKRLKKDLKEVGMVQPIVVNKRTMNIVGGHQRIAAMDSILKKPDYSLTVALIDVDEREEAKINILLNNPEVQGEWDYFKLEGIKEQFDFSLDEIGFDLEDGLVLFNMSETDPAVGRAELSEEEQEKRADQNRSHAAKVRENNAEENAMDTFNTAKTDISLVVVFPTTRAKQQFCILVGKKRNETHIKSSILVDLYRQKYDITRVGE